MNIRSTLLATAIGIALLTGPLNAGGPVIVEDAYEAEPQGHSLKDAAPYIIAALIIGGLILSGGNCNQGEPEPTPTPAPC